MKILMIHDFGYPVGGAEVLLQAELAGLRAQGHEARLLAGTPTTAPGAFNQYSFTTAEAGYAQKFRSYLANPSAAPAVRAVALDFQPDLIHLHSVLRFSPAGVRAASRLAPAVMTLHDYGLLYPRLGRTKLPRAHYCGVGDDACCVTHAGAFRYWYERWRTGRQLAAASRLAAVIVPSRFMAELASSLGVSHLQVIANGVSPGHPTPAPLANQRILYIGRLEPEKGVAQLIQQWPLVIQSYPGARLTIAGDGTQSAALRRQAADLGLTQSITFTGEVLASQTPDLYQTHRLAVTPSRWAEPFGLTGPEAMSAGRPVIASGRGGISQWLQSGVNGLAADPDDGHSLADAINTLLGDNQLYQRLADGAVQTSRQFSLAHHVDQLVRLYGRLLNAQQLDGAHTAATPNHTPPA